VDRTLPATGGAVVRMAPSTRRHREARSGLSRPTSARRPGTTARP